jgi:hypothetical protein
VGVGCKMVDEDRLGCDSLVWKGKRLVCDSASGGLLV